MKIQKCQSTQGEEIKKKMLLQTHFARFGKACFYLLHPGLTFPPEPHAQRNPCQLSAQHSTLLDLRLSCYFPSGPLECRPSCTAQHTSAMSPRILPKPCRTPFTQAALLSFFYLCPSARPTPPSAHQVPGSRASVRIACNRASPPAPVPASAYHHPFGSQMILDPLLPGSLSAPAAHAGMRLQLPAKAAVPLSQAASPAGSPD